MKLILLQAIWEFPYEDGSILETIGVFSTQELAERQWKLCTKDDESCDSVKFSKAITQYLEFNLDEVSYT